MDDNNRLDQLALKIKCEGLLESARAYLEACEYELALSQAQKALSYDPQDDGDAEARALVAAIHGAMKQAEANEQERLRREKEAEAEAAEAARLEARRIEMEKQRSREAEARALEKQRATNKLMFVAAGILILCITVAWFASSVKDYDGKHFGPWFEPKVLPLFLSFATTGTLVGIGSSRDVTFKLAIASIIVIGLASDFLIALIVSCLWGPILLVATFVGFSRSWRR